MEIVNRFSFILLASLGLLPHVQDSGERTVLMPLKVGNIWDYVNNYSTRVDKDTIVNGERWYHDTNNMWHTNRSDGLHTAMFAIQASPRISLEFAYPAKPGLTYLNFMGDTVTVVQRHVRITVEAGTFYCYKYRVSSSFHGLLDSSVSEVYAAPGVGIVRIDRFDNSKGTLSPRGNQIRLYDCILK